MAPDDKQTIKSDVYSYGLVCMKLLVRLSYLGDHSSLLLFLGIGDVGGIDRTVSLHGDEVGPVDHPSAYKRRTATYTQRRPSRVPWLDATSLGTQP